MERDSFIRLGDFWGYSGCFHKNPASLHQPDFLTGSLAPAGLSLEGTEIFCAQAAQHALRCIFKHGCSEVRFKMSPLKEILKRKGFEKDDVLVR